MIIPEFLANTNNSAGYYFHNGGAMFISDLSFSITKSTFTNNTAAQYGGVIVVFDSSFNTTNST